MLVSVNEPSFTVTNFLMCFRKFSKYRVGACLPTPRLTQSWGSTIPTPTRILDLLQYRLSHTLTDGAVQVVLYLWEGFLPSRFPVDFPHRHPAAPAAAPPLAALFHRLAPQSWSSATGPISTSSQLASEAATDPPVKHVCGLQSLEDLSRQLVKATVTLDSAWTFTSKCNTVPMVRQTPLTSTSPVDAMFHIDVVWMVTGSKSIFTQYMPVKLPSPLTQCWTLTATLVDTSTVTLNMNRPREIEHQPPGNEERSTVTWALSSPQSGSGQYEQTLWKTSVTAIN